MLWWRAVFPVPRVYCVINQDIVEWCGSVLKVEREFLTSDIAQIAKGISV